MTKRMKSALLITLVLALSLGGANGQAAEEEPGVGGLGGGVGPDNPDMLLVEAYPVDPDALREEFISSGTLALRLPVHGEVTVEADEVKLTPQTRWETVNEDGDVVASGPITDIPRG